jgi:hypothetical protein
LSPSTSSQTRQPSGSFMAIASNQGKPSSRPGHNTAPRRLTAARFPSSAFVPAEASEVLMPTWRSTVPPSRQATEASLVLKPTHGGFNHVDALRQWVCRSVRRLP